MMTSARTRVLVSALVFLMISLAFAAPAVAAKGSSRPPRDLNGAVSGVVLDEVGVPVRGATVQVMAPFWTGFNSMEWGAITGTSTTGRNGTYKVSVPPGTYRVWFIPPDRDTHCMEAYPNAATLYFGDSIVVTAGRTTSRVSVMLDPDPCAIEGSVTDAATGLPLEGMLVRTGIQAHAIVNTEFGDAYTDAGGHYRVSGFKSYVWGAWAQDVDGIAPQYLELPLGFWDDEWTPQGETKVIDFDMEAEGFVSLAGRVVDSVSGNPIEGATVQYTWTDGQDDQWTGPEFVTGSDGVFEFTNIPQGMVTLRADAPDYIGENWDNSDWWAAWTIDISRGSTHDIGDWALDPIAP